MTRRIYKPVPSITFSEIMGATGAFTFKETTTATAVGSDLVQNEFWRTSATPRVITGFGYTGSAAAGDCAVELYIDGTPYGKFYNTTGGANKVPTVENDIVRIGVPVPAGSLIQVKVSVASGTNVCYGTIQLSPMPMRPAPFRGNFRRGGRTYGRRF